MNLKKTCKLLIIDQHLLWNASVVESLQLLISLRLCRLFISCHQFEEEQIRIHKVRKRENVESSHLLYQANSMGCKVFAYRSTFTFDLLIIIIYC